MATAGTIHREMMDAWNHRDFDAVRSLLHDEYTYTGGDGKEMTGPDVGVQVAKAYAAAFPDGNAEVKTTYVQGDVGISEFEVTGTHQGNLMGVAPTGKRLSIVVCNIIEMRDGKVYREREYIDTGAMWAQLGVRELPASS